MAIKIQRRNPLKNYTTFKLGGPAKYFVSVKNIDELREAVLFANKNDTPFFILGGGSNVVFQDSGYNGLVIKNEFMGIDYTRLSNSKTECAVCAGEDWDRFVHDTVSRGLWGLENLSGIPGTVGAAPIQNIGAYGEEVKKYIKWVEALEAISGNVVLLSNDECQFEYRSSVFKKEKRKKYIVTRVCFELSEKGTPNTSYKDIKDYFAGKKTTPLLSEVRDAIVFIRSKKFPDLKELGTAGSFFKNPIVSKCVYKQLKRKYPDMPCHYISNNLVKVSLAWILDHVCALKGFRLNNFGTYKTQPLVIIHHYNGTTEELTEFIDIIAKKIFEKTNITIEKEVVFA